MAYDNLDKIIDDLTNDLTGLENVIERLKKRQTQEPNNVFQESDLETANILSKQLTDTIEQLKKCVPGG